MSGVIIAILNSFGRNIRAVLKVLAEAGLMAKPSKCKWARRSVQYLGHRVGQSCVAVGVLLKKLQVSGDPD